jgi:helix-turn-helix protein
MARSQLLLIAAKEFEETEAKILYIIDSSLKSVSHGPQSAVILGVCLRRVALLYRQMLKRYKRIVIDCRLLNFFDVGRRLVG